MKILEVRDGFIKFEADESISLSSFIQVSGLAKNYIAQIIQIKRSGINSIAIAKILFLYDGSLQPYDKTLPSEDSEIKDFTSNILNNSINANEPIIAGVMPEKDLNIIIDASAFNKKMLMSIDDKDENNIIVRNLTKQFNNLNKKVVIIDTLGIINAKKFTAGVDFKLPLDTASLAFMYQDCLNDATSDSKSLIIEIFKDLADYSKTVPFVPFETLKNIVDDMVDKSHVFKLLVLKNKLAKFHRLGYFAKNKLEADKIEKILEQKCSIIDLSKLDSNFQNRYLAFLYEKMQSSDNLQVFLELSNTTSKKNLKSILEGSVPTAFITHSKFKYLNDIKNLFDNFIISPSLANNDVFKVYNTFLRALTKGTYLIAGEAVNYIPLVSSSKIINETIPLPNQIVPEKEEISEATNLEDEISSEEEKDSSETEDSKDIISEDKSLETETTGEVPQQTEDSIIEDTVTEEISDQETAGTDENGVEPVEPEIIEESNEEIIEENRLSKEEILANIEEKSDDIISNAAKDLIQPVGNMFASDDSEDSEYEEDEGDEGDEGDEDIPEEETKEEELAEEDLEASVENLENEQVEEAVIGDFSAITDEEEEEINFDNYSDDNIIEETPAEIAEDEEILPSGIVEDSFEELPLETAFDSDIESSDEILDYTPVENLEPETLDLDSEIDDSESAYTENKILEEAPTETIAEENQTDEVEIPEDFDLDLDSSEDTNEEPSVIEEDTEPISEEQDILPISQTEDSDFEEIVELDPNETDENDIIIDMTEDDLDNPPKSEEEINEQIVKDVDKVFTTRKDDDLSDSDLDLIDELNNDDGVLEEISDEDNLLEESPNDKDNDGILESDNDTLELEENKEDEILETKNSSTPIVPVYDADIPQEDMVISDPIQQGDTVTHAKYGSGVVEKMIKYGNKTLFSINFDNIGRRLLDPTLTEIKKA